MAEAIKLQPAVQGPVFADISQERRVPGPVGDRLALSFHTQQCVSPDHLSWPETLFYLSEGDVI